MAINICNHQTLMLLMMIVVILLSSTQTYRDWSPNRNENVDRRMRRRPRRRCPPYGWIYTKISTWIEKWHYNPYRISVRSECGVEQIESIDWLMVGCVGLKPETIFNVCGVEAVVSTTPHTYIKLQIKVKLFARQSESTLAANVRLCGFDDSEYKNKSLLLHKVKMKKHRTTIICMVASRFKPSSKSHLNFYSSHFVIKLSSMKRLFFSLCGYFFVSFSLILLLYLSLFFIRNSQLVRRNRSVCFCLVFCWNLFRFSIYLDAIGWVSFHVEFMFISRLTINLISNHLIFVRSNGI